MVKAWKVFRELAHFLTFVRNQSLQKTSNTPPMCGLRDYSIKSAKCRNEITFLQSKLQVHHGKLIYLSGKKLNYGVTGVS